MIAAVSLNQRTAIVPARIPPQTISADRTAVIAAIASAADRSGVDFDYLLNQAKIESGLNAAARATTSSATGLFQFTRQTWLATVKANGAALGYGWAADAITSDPSGRYSVRDPALRQAIYDLRTDVHAASHMAAAFAVANADRIASSTGRTPAAVDLYLAHFLGPAGASKFLLALEADPEAPAAPLFPAAANANRNIFYDRSGQPRSLAQIRHHFAAKFEGEPAQPTAAPASPMMHARTTDTPRVAMEPDRPRWGAERVFGQIEAMPKRLSLDFAAQTYRRLASIGGDSWRGS